MRQTSSQEADDIKWQAWQRHGVDSIDNRRDNKCINNFDSDDIERNNGVNGDCYRCA